MIKLFANQIEWFEKEEGNDMINSIRKLSKLYGSFVVAYIAGYMIFAVVLCIVSYIKFVR